MTTAYLEHFGLTRPPFQVRPDPDYFFADSRAGEILDALLQAAKHSEHPGSIVVADIGCGKTLLARQLARRLPEDIKPLLLSFPCLGRDDLLDALGSELRLTDLSADSDTKRFALQQALREQRAHGQRPLLIIDEAHTLPAESLEEVIALLHPEPQDTLAGLVLIGQPGLDTLLTDPRLRRIQDDHAPRFDLTPFSRAEVAAYIDYRLATSGRQGEPLFTEAALDLISKDSSGRALRINLLADLALQAAAAEDAAQVDKPHVRQALAHLPEAVPLAHDWVQEEAPPARTRRLPLVGGLAALVLVGSAVWAYNATRSHAPTPATPPALASAAHTQPTQPQTEHQPPATTPASDTANHPAVPTAATTATAAPPVPSHAPLQLAAAASTTPAPSSAAAPAATTAAIKDKNKKAEKTGKAPSPPPATQTQTPSKTVAPATPPAAHKPATTQTAQASPAPRPHSTPSQAAAPALKLDGELASVQRVIPFAVSMTRLGPKGHQAFAEIVPLAKKAERVNVRGRTDSSGNREENRRLAKARATTVLSAFVHEGVARKKLKATYCTRCFIASNDTADGRRTNRRVDIEVIMPAKLALRLPRPVYSAPDVDNGPVLLARLDDRYLGFGQRR